MERKHIAAKLGILIILVGIIVLCYPFLSRFRYAKKQEELLVQYQELQKEVKAEKQVEQKETQPAAELKDIQYFLEIPDIGEYLPIYASTEEADLRRGVGVLEGSDAPGSGLGSHSVLCGHAGFAKAALFSKLHELEIGDEFYIYLGAERLVYKVDQILVVKPEEQEALLPEDEKDYVTLLTCTPPGRNTHRLLVRGEKTE